MKHYLFSLALCLACAVAYPAFGAEPAAAAKAATDQSDKAEDLKITQDIRQAVVKDSHLSITAKNVVIVTVEGQVTLRGPVTTEAEKMTIDTLAKTTAGETKVINQLEVKD